jgi:hypothetical protein
MVAQGATPEEAVNRISDQRVEYVDDAPPA